MPQSPSWLTGIYRAGLWLCPPAFRYRFGDELLRDFEDGLHDVNTESGRSGDRAAFLARNAYDLSKTAADQWLRAGGLGSAFLACSGLILAVVGVDVLRAASRRADSVSPEHAELVTLMILIGAVLLVIVATIFFTQTLLHPRPRRPRPAR